MSIKAHADANAKVSTIRKNRSPDPDLARYNTSCGKANTPYFLPLRAGVKIICTVDCRTQIRQSARLFFQSSNWDSTTPSPERNLSPLVPGGVGTLARGRRGGGVPIRRLEKKPGTLSNLRSTIYNTSLLRLLHEKNSRAYSYFILSCLFVEMLSSRRELGKTF